MPPTLEQSLDDLLVSGGDNRLKLSSGDGLNKYGCGPRPRDVVPFGSCTSSSASPRGYAAARRTLQSLRDSDNFSSAVEACAEGIRRRLAELLELDDEVDVALAPSGTDVEFLAVALAAGESTQPIINIVVGPNEVGSGTPLAAGCCHYDQRTPHERASTPGAAIDNDLTARVTVETVPLRSDSGRQYAESEIDAAVTQRVIEAAEGDAIVLLHIVAHSKTGVYAPSFACVEGLKRVFPNLVVVIDAAQGRISRAGLRTALGNGNLVIFTGSKFYGGPPFSGALLVPRAFGDRLEQCGQLPNGFADYFSAVEMPQRWTRVRQSLPSPPNLGVLLRWSAALAEIEAFYEVDETTRSRVLRCFETSVPQLLGGSETIEMVPDTMSLYGVGGDRLESRSTVFGFWVKSPGSNGYFDKPRLAELHRDLNSDVTDRYPEMDAAIATTCFHVGQPVKLGDAGHVLRIALGSELIVRVAEDQRLGATLDERLTWLRRQIMSLRDKIECLASARAAVAVPAATA